MKKIIYTVVLCLLASTFAYAQQNLLVNPGFEEASTEEALFPGWTITEGKPTVTITPESSRVQEGSKSLKIFSTNTAEVIQYIEAMPGKKYDVSIKYYVEAIGHANTMISLGVIYLNEDADETKVLGGYTTSLKKQTNTLILSEGDTWGELTFQTEELNEKTRFIKLTFTSMRSITVYIDQASITEVGSASLLTQEISGLSSAINKQYGDDSFTLPEKADSNLSVTYSVADASVATLTGAGNRVSLRGAGTTTITATVEGNAVYAPLVRAVTLTVSKAPQSIRSFESLSKNTNDVPFALTASCVSGLPVTYSIADASVATLSGNVVTIVGAGTTTITASQSGNKDYEAAPDSTVTLTVSGGAGLSEVSSSLPVRFESGRLTVVAPIDTPIEVYSVVGVKLQSRRSSGGETVIDRLPKQGALIVRIGKTVTKVIR